jgi:large subunit ribosomal protein L10
LEAKSKKQEKIKVVQELHERFDKAGAVILTDYKGLTVAQLTEIRNRLRKCGAEYKVVKNTLAKRASEGTDAHKLEGYFSGTTGVVISYDDVVTPAKVLLEYAVKLEPFKIRVGILEGIVLEPARIKEVANMPSREALIGRALGGIQSPLYGLAGTLQGVLSKLVYVLNAVGKSQSSN